ncbi:hypothetical protein BJ684DRAFT_20549 [Piptocephalis cylindrospora]|uniref:Late endosomal/lysosomal adaptor and MAPK and MTOR activator 5 n=1 Tax=Piptocephalis cylindrospora TaxID=1907219 RepID=A0A4P9Y2M4_9FUNG|nr:hypothetical protein BJ684DRAFT_20549 [Piptocephalis cylindrospora]|eukprot:RKP12934.1 hypothetical protein BJ684DRAFT_20549 [Piptocephalis cylindrospora]
MTTRSLEGPVEQMLDNTMKEDGVRAVILVDSLGLCVASRGPVSPDASGLILALSRQAQILTEASTEEQENQVVTKIETSQGSIYIRTGSSYIVGVYK